MQLLLIHGIDLVLNLIFFVLLILHLLLFLG